MPTISKGLSIEENLYHEAVQVARAERRSFSFVVCRAIERELAARTLQPATAPARLAPPEDVIFTKDVAARLQLNPRTVLRRANTPGDPLHAARSRIGRKKPQAFSLAKIQALERGLVVTAA